MQGKKVIEKCVHEKRKKVLQKIRIQTRFANTLVGLVWE